MLLLRNPYLCHNSPAAAQQPCACPAAALQSSCGRPTAMQLPKSPVVCNSTAAAQLLCTFPAAAQLFSIAALLHNSPSAAQQPCGGATTLQQPNSPAAAHEVPHEALAARAAPFHLGNANPKPSKQAYGLQVPVCVQLPGCLPSIL